MGERQKGHVKGGCFTCERSWEGKNAQTTAARHHDKTGHATWAEVAKYIYYGQEQFAAAEPPEPTR